jgi:hypothetical protein
VEPDSRSLRFENQEIARPAYRIASECPAITTGRESAKARNRKATVWNGSCSQLSELHETTRLDSVVTLGVNGAEPGTTGLATATTIARLFFGYQKWFEYEVQALIPYISHGPLIFWMYPVFGV